MYFYQITHSFKYIVKNREMIFSPNWLIVKEKIVRSILEK